MSGSRGGFSSERSERPVSDDSDECPDVGSLVGRECLIMVADEVLMILFLRVPCIRLVL
ncbi:hypothetical protein ACTOVP_00865 [Arcanobacterium canis]